MHSEILSSKIIVFQLTCFWVTLTTFGGPGTSGAVTAETTVLFVLNFSFPLRRNENLKLYLNKKNS